jgi:hypothetical protein
VLGLTAELGDDRGRTFDAEHAGERHGEGGARRQPCADGQVGGDVHGPARRRSGERHDGGRQAGPGGLKGAELPGVGIDVDGYGRRFQEGVRAQVERVDPCRLEGDRGPGVDGHGQGASLVVVGVVPDQVDPAGPPGVRHAAIIAPAGGGDG